MTRRQWTGIGIMTGGALSLVSLIISASVSLGAMQAAEAPQSAVQAHQTPTPNPSIPPTATPVPTATQDPSTLVRDAGSYVVHRWRYYDPDLGWVVCLVTRVENTSNHARPIWCHPVRTEVFTPSTPLDPRFRTPTR